MSPRLRILLVVYGPIAERMSAPEIRGWEMAKVLARRHDVTVAAPGELHDGRDGIRMVASDRRTLLAEARRHDALIVPRVPPYLFAGLADSDTLIVADLYNPFEEEHAELTASRAIRREISLTRVANRMQLRNADVHPVRGRAAARAPAGRARRARRRVRRRPPVEVVAFGLPEDPPPSDRRPMRARFPQIGAGRRRRAVVGQRLALVRRADGAARVRAARGRPPGTCASSSPTAATRAATGRCSTAATEARALAADIGLLGEQRVLPRRLGPQEERHHYLLEADVGLTLHRDTAETAVAARGRYMDYVWAGLPCVLGAGDVLADRFAEAGFASTVAAGDLDGASAALGRLVDDAGRARAAPGGVAPAGRRVPLDGDRAAAPARARRRRGASAPRPRPPRRARPRPRRVLRAQGAARRDAGRPEPEPAAA